MSVSEQLEELATVLEALSGPNTTIQIFHFTFDENIALVNTEFPIPPFDFLSPLEIPDDENYTTLGFSYFLKPLPEKGPGIYDMAIPFLATPGYDPILIAAYLAGLNTDPEYPGITDGEFVGLTKFTAH